MTKYYQTEETTTESYRPQLNSVSPQYGKPSSPGNPPAASTATRELDDLMASLSDFKVSLFL